MVDMTEHLEDMDARVARAHEWNREALAAATADDVAAIASLGVDLTGLQVRKYALSACGCTEIPERTTGKPFAQGCAFAMHDGLGNVIVASQAIA